MALLAGGARARPDHHTTGRAASLRSLRGQVRAAPTEHCFCENVGRNGADRPFLARSSKPPRPSQLARMIRMKFAGEGPARPIFLPSASGTFSSPLNWRFAIDYWVHGVNAPIRRSSAASRKRAVAPFADKGGRNACLRRKNFLDSRDLFVTGLRAFASAIRVLMLYANVKSRVGIGIKNAAKK
jgi:hypothetical protein